MDDEKLILLVQINECLYNKSCISYKIAEKKKSAWRQIAAEMNVPVRAQDAFSFVDEMRQTAEQAQYISNFIYEPTSGLYYDQKSGYYYNAEHGLYYDGNTGCYYNFNQGKNCYEFHSQVKVREEAPTQEDDELSEVAFDEFGVVTNLEKSERLCQENELQRQEKEHKYKKPSKNKTKEKNLENKKFSYKKRKHLKKYNKYIESDSENENFEEGELTTSNSSTSSGTESNSESEKRKVASIECGDRLLDIAKKYPPSLRIIVQETNLEDLKVGSLNLITFKGGTLGREGNHDVIIPDVNVSKFHLKFIYDSKESIYKCVDLGSRNGTILNGSRMSGSKIESNVYDVVHGSTIQISHTKLLCHVHEGNNTCGLCEPGLLIDAQQQEIPSGSALSHKEQLKKIQRKYGLENYKFVAAKQNTGNCNIISRGMSTSCTRKSNKNPYQDRAATRRLKVGSSTDKEKTQTASIDTAISSDNKGFRMLSKLGWNKGESLGKVPDLGGLLEPINVISNAGYKGLGCSDPIAGITLTSPDKKKMESIRKTKERYETSDIFTYYDIN